MSKRRRPLAALALIAMVALISACGSSAPAATGWRQRPTTPPPSSEGGEVRRVHARQRGQRVPGPGRVGQVHHRRVANGSSLDTSTPAFTQAISACKNLEPAGFTGSKRSPEQQSAALEFAQCIRHQRREGLPGPRPTAAARRHEPNPIRQSPRWDEHSQRGDAEVPQCCGSSSDGPVMTEDVDAGRRGRPGCRGRHRRRGRHIPPRQQALAAQQPPVNTASVEKRTLSAIGLPGRDPDLSGANGRLAVLRDQPGPRDLHPAARARPGGRTRSRALSGERSPGGVALGSTPAYRTLQKGERTRCRRAQRGSGRARVRHPSSAQPHVRRVRVGDHHGGEKLQAALGATQTGTLTLGQAVFEPTAVRVTSVSAQLGGAPSPGRR